MRHLSKKAKIATAGLVTALCLVGVSLYSYVRVTSDVKVLTPREWVWLDGKTELMTVPGSDVLLIRRFKDIAEEDMPEPVDKYSERNYALNRMVLERFRAEFPLPEAVSSREELDPVYYFAYNPDRADLKRVDASVWDEANGIVTSCGERYEAVRKIEWSGSPGKKKKRIGRIGDLKLSLAGHRSVKSAVSPSGRAQAFVSARPDFQFDFVMPGSVQGSAWQHFHEVVWLPEPRVVGGVVRIPYITNLVIDDKSRPDRLLCMGWSADERFVVYVGRRSLCVVPVDLRGESP